MSVRRVYVEKKPEFAVKAGELREEISSYLGIETVTGVRDAGFAMMSRTCLRRRTVRHW